MSGSIEAANNFAREARTARDLFLNKIPVNFFKDTTQFLSLP
jgi:hypothetical protein